MDYKKHPEWKGLDRAVSLSICALSSELHQMGAKGTDPDIIADMKKAWETMMMFYQLLTGKDLNSDD